MAGGRSTSSDEDHFLMSAVRSPEARREVSVAESYLLQFLQLLIQQFPHRSYADAFIAIAATFLNRQGLAWDKYRIGRWLARNGFSWSQLNLSPPGVGSRSRSAPVGRGAFRFASPPAPLPFVVSVECTFNPAEPRSGPPTSPGLGWPGTLSPGAAPPAESWDTTATVQTADAPTPGSVSPVTRPSSDVPKPPCSPPAHRCHFRRDITIVSDSEYRSGSDSVYRGW
jgi:hypothetical protein